MAPALSNFTLNDQRFLHLGGSPHNVMTITEVNTTELSYGDEEFNAYLDRHKHESTCPRIR